MCVQHVNLTLLLGAWVLRVWDWNQHKVSIKTIACIDYKRTKEKFRNFFLPLCRSDGTDLESTASYRSKQSLILKDCLSLQMFFIDAKLEKYWNDTLIVLFVCAICVFFYSPMLCVYSFCFLFVCFFAPRTVIKPQGCGTGSGNTSMEGSSSP